MNYNIPNDLMNNVEKNLRKHVKNKTRKRHIYKTVAAIISLLVILPASTLAFAKYNSSIQYKQEIDLARKNKNITEVNKTFKYKDVQFTIKEILADATGIEVIYAVSNPKYSINEISFCDKDGKEFTKESGYIGYIWGYTRPNLSSNDKEKAFCINMNDDVVSYIKNNPVSIKINNLAVNDKKPENLIDKVSSLINNNSNLNVDWTLKMQIPMQQVKVIPINKEYSLDIGTLKINSLKISILKSSFDYSFVPKDKNIKGIEPIFSIRLGNEYAIDQWLDGCNNEDGSTTGTQTFNSIYYKHLDAIGIKLIGIRANFSNPNLYKIDKNKLPMEFDCNGEKFKITSANQKGDSNEYTVEYNKTGRIYNELAFNFPGINTSRQTNKNENIKFKDQSSRDLIYNSLKQTVPNLKDIEKQFGSFQTGVVGATFTTNSNSTEFKVSAVKNIICNEDEIVIHK